MDTLLFFGINNSSHYSSLHVEMKIPFEFCPNFGYLPSAMSPRTLSILVMPISIILLSGCREKTVPPAPNEQASPVSTSKELSREQAGEMIRQIIDNTFVKYITIKDSAIAKLKSDGLIREWFSIYEFTEEGREFFSPLSPTPDRIGLAPLNDVAPTWYFEIGRNIRQTLKEVTGIRTDGDIKVVECEMVYHFPSDSAERLKRVVFGGMKTRAFFSLYDDGWRCIELQANRH